jgi:immune inhibitor A
MSSLYMEFRRHAKKGESFGKYLESIGFVDPSVEVNGMDDQVLAQPAADGGLELIAIPHTKVDGQLRVIVLLVDFDDRPGHTEVGHYEDLLFSRNTHPTGSMADFYAEVSNGKVDIVGSVHGWLRMPETYEYYVNNASGTGLHDYPRNCKRLAEDAAKVAIKKGVKFPSDLDKLGRDFVTAFFIVHAGRGAEYLNTKQAQKKDIWSHKWTVANPVNVGPNLAVTTYLTVPQDCVVGVCAHELGHLAFQWQDFYDPNYDDDGKFWNGTGDWDLMASGSHNYGGAIPAHPAALHKVQHGWVPVQELTSSGDVVLKPSTEPGGRVCKIVSPAFADGQYLLLENRRRRGFDKHIPGEGLLVWRVDESMEMYAPATPGMQLVQADGRQELESPTANNQGDDGDPFPGSEVVTELKDTGKASTSFPGKKSGVRLSNIQVDAAGVVKLSVQIAPSTGSAPAKTTTSAAAKTPAALSARAKRKPPLTAITNLAGVSASQEAPTLKPKPRARPTVAKAAAKE